MVTMDFKCITWVGNVYEKFEAMCLEVEETVVQDTIKYVENQVQTVGASVKQFYSDVVQDLLPETSVDSDKRPQASMLHEYAPVCYFGKTKEATDEVKQKDDLWVVEKKEVCAPNLHSLPAGDFRFQTPLKKYDDGGGKHRRTKLGAKRISRKENLSQVSRNQMQNHVETDSNKGSTVQLPLESISSTVHLIEDSRLNSIEESCNEKGNSNESVQCVSSDKPATNVNSAVESDKLKEPEIRQSFNGSFFADECQGNRVATEMGWSENKSCDLVPSDTISSKGISLQFSQKSIEESCVLVNNDEVCLFIPHKDSKGKPYKKKIRDAIASRMRSARKQEYKRLALQWYSKEGLENLKLIGTAENRSSAHQTCESDWELL